MYKIITYVDERGRSPVDSYLTVLELRNDKDARMNIKKINADISYLAIYGIRKGAPMIKHIRGNIYELRPLDKRILFFRDGDTYVLLHIFRKETRKTPRSEIIQAENEMRDYLERKNYE